MIFSISPTNVILALTLFGVAGVTAITSYEEDMRITAKEKATLDKFKKLVIPKIPQNSLIRNYINDDLYFIRYLRGASFDVASAERNLLNTLKWREEQRMDTIDEEDWSYFEREYPMYVDTQDKEGRPGAELWFGDWDVRKAVLSGRASQVTRWLVKLMEMNQRHLYEARAKGRRVSQGTLLVEIGGFNIVQHGCSRCLATYAAATVVYAAHYPRLLEGIHLVNMVPAFDIVINLLKPLFGPANRDVLQTYVRKSQWEPYLDSRFDKSERSLRFGGTKARDNF